MTYYLVTVLFIGNETIFWSLPFPRKESCVQARAESVLASTKPGSIVSYCTDKRPREDGSDLLIAKLPKAKPTRRKWTYHLSARRDATHFAIGTPWKANQRDPAVEAKPVPGQIGALYAPLRPAIERAGADLTATIKANAQIQADLLRTASPAVGALVAGGKVKVIASYYELASGRVTLLGW